MLRVQFYSWTQNLLTLTTGILPCPTSRLSSPERLSVLAKEKLLGKRHLDRRVVEERLIDVVCKCSVGIVRR